VLEHLDLGGPLDPAGIAAQVAGMVERELLLPAVAEAVDVAQLAAFFRTPLGTRLVAARDSVRRELTFTLALHPARVHSGLEAAPPGEFVVVQGIVDCVFRDPAGLVLVDFKTDRAGAGTPLLPEYIQQLRVYAEAVSAALAQPVGEAYLVFLSTGTVVPVAAPLPAGS
jgi:ATP-dependent helicase/nuclease subunit A